MLFSQSRLVFCKMHDRIHVYLLEITTDITQDICNSCMNVRHVGVSKNSGKTPKMEGLFHGKPLFFNG